MKFYKKTGEYMFFGFIIILIIYILCLALKFQETTTKSFRKYVNEYELNNGLPKNSFEGGIQNQKEGFSNRESDSFYNKKSGKFEKKDNTYEVIENKLRSLNQELGGEKGKREIKDILKNTKKIINLECSKCMMNMISNNKGSRTIEIDDMIYDEDDENCIKCKRYTELSDNIENMLANM